MKRRTTKGKFYIDPNNKYTYGDLKWDNNNGFLELYSNPTDINKSEFFIDSLFGILDGQHAVTIKNCTFQRFNFPMNDYIVHFDFLVRGYGKVWNQTETKLKSFKIYFSHLQDWANIKALESEYEYHEIKIRRTKPEIDFELYRCEDFLLNLNYETNFPIINHKPNFHITQNTFIHLHLIKDLDFKEIFTLIDKINCLLNIISGVNFTQNNILDCKNENAKDFHILRDIEHPWNGLNVLQNINYLFTFDDIYKKTRHQDYF